MGHLASAPGSPEHPARGRLRVARGRLSALGQQIKNPLARLANKGSSTHDVSRGKWTKKRNHRRLKSQDC